MVALVLIFSPPLILTSAGMRLPQAFLCSELAVNFNFESPEWCFTAALPGRRAPFTPSCFVVPDQVLKGIDACAVRLNTREQILGDSGA
jgi:hypothetical protein